MKITLVTSNRKHCGIREYGKFLMAEFANDPEVQITEVANPDALSLGLPDADIIHVNHHAALHSSWREDTVAQYQKHGYKVTVTQHDTFEDFRIMQERGFPDFRRANGLVVHEDVNRLNGNNIHYIPQGVLPAAKGAEQVAVHTLGSAGFDFPWKNYDMLARVTSDAGWVLLLIAPEMSQSRVEEIKRINPGSMVLTSWLSAEEVVFLLSSCTATGFLYSTGNSGTSGAIRLGIAARRPMVAFQSRQNRDLAKELALNWVNTEEEAKQQLSAFGYKEVVAANVDWMKELADSQSWGNAAKQYKEMWMNALEGE